MKHLLKLVQSISTDSSVQRWRDRLLNSDGSQYLIAHDTKIKSMQDMYMSFAPPDTYSSAFASFVTMFSTAPEEDSISYLRGSLQVLIEYSLYTSHVDWISRKETLKLEKSVSKFEAMLSKSVSRFGDPGGISLDNCMCHALLIEKEANLALLRVAMIKTLALLATYIQPSTMYKCFAVKDSQRHSNANHLLSKMTPQSHAFISTAFACVINSDFKSLQPPFALDTTPKEALLVENMGL